MPQFQRRNDTTGQYPGGRPSSLEQKGAPTRQEEDIPRGQGPRNEGTREAAVQGNPEGIPTDDSKNQSPKLARLRYQGR